MGKFKHHPLSKAYACLFNIAFWVVDHKISGDIQNQHRQKNMFPVDSPNRSKMIQISGLTDGKRDKSAAKSAQFPWVAIATEDRGTWLQFSCFVRLPNTTNSPLHILQASHVRTEHGVFYHGLSWRFPK